MSFQRGIYNALANDFGLSLLLDNQTLPNTTTPIRPIFFQRLPPGLKIPFITFFTVGGPPPEWTFEAGYWETIDWQLSVFTEDPDRTRDIAKQCDVILTWTNPTIHFDDVRDMGTFRTSPIDNLLLEPAVDESDQDVWMTPLLYQSRLIRALGTTQRV